VTHRNNVFKNIYTLLSLYLLLDPSAAHVFRGGWRLSRNFERGGCEKQWLPAAGVAKTNEVTLTGPKGRATHFSLWHFYFWPTNFAACAARHLTRWLAA